MPMLVQFLGITVTLPGSLQLSFVFDVSTQPLPFSIYIGTWVGFICVLVWFQAWHVLSGGAAR